MKQLAIICFVAALAIVCGSAQANSVNLLVNPSFEQSSLGNIGSYVTVATGSTAITGWVTTRGNARGSIDYIGTYWKASDGSRSLDLDDLYAAGGIAQTFDTVAGQRYEVSFDMAGNPAGPPTIKQMCVTAGGQSADFSFNETGHSLSSMGWRHTTWEFTATSSRTTLEFYSLSPAENAFGPALDNVSVTTIESATPIPEPLTLAGAVMGLGSLGGYFRKRRLAV